MSIQLTPEQLNSLIQGAVSGALALLPHGPSGPKPQRPEVDFGFSEDQWAFFAEEWTIYKERANLQGVTVQHELRAACSPELRKELFDFFGSEALNNLSEESLLTHIRSAAVQGKNKAVHRQEFYTIVQAAGQPCHAFVAKLRGKAAQCGFSMRCPNPDCQQTNCYAEAMVSDQMVVGAADRDVQGELLARDTQLPSFKDKFELFQSLERGKIATSQLSAPSSLAAHKSDYRRAKTTVDNPPTNRLRTKSAQKPSGCPGCGYTDHGPGTDKPRALHCPARAKTCNFCTIQGHIEKVCRKKRLDANESAQNAIQSNRDRSEADVGSDVSDLFGLQTTSNVSSVDQAQVSAAQPHMEWVGDRFTPSAPDPHPSLSVQVSVLHDSHARFGKSLTHRKRVGIHSRVQTTVHADTGAMTCVSGPELLQQLHCPEQYLVRTRHRIHGVTGTDLDIMGSLLAEIEADGQKTKQVVYISRNTTGFYLSERALKDLGTIPRDFPHAEPRDLGSQQAAAETKTDGIAPCGCSLRSPAPPPPVTLPYPPTAENRHLLEQWLLDKYQASAFNVCEHQLLPKMDGRPLDIHFRPDAEPAAFHCPIPVPHHWKKQVKADLDRDVRLGIIEPVPQGSPTVWCARMVVVAKKDGTPRRTVDLQNLNAATYRETHHTPSPFNQASVVPPGQKKTVLDAWNGYHSLPLSPAASDATTFITEWGRYRYLSAPQGFHAAGDAYTRRFDDITVDEPRKTKCVDDSLLWDTNIESAFWHVVQYLIVCSNAGIVFNPKKFRFACDEVDFAGFTVTATGIRPARHLLEAIQNFPTPRDITGARSWFGLVNQVAYAFSMTEEMAPFRDLLKPGQAWYWDEQLDNIFKRSRAVITQQVEQGVRSFEVGRPTCLATDWSKQGLGFCLLQKFCRCTMEQAPNCCKDGWRLVFAGSRFTSPAESRYAPIEGEALAVVDALEKCRMFVLGCPNLTVAVDHKPLVKILGDRSLEGIHNPRLFSLKEKSLRYKFAIQHVPGTWHVGPDACSRYPVADATASSVALSSFLSAIRFDTTREELDASLAIDRRAESFVTAAMSGGGHTMGIDIQAVTWDRVKHTASRDEEMQELVSLISSGFPASKQDLSPSMQPYWDIRSSLSHLDGVSLYGDRIIVPRDLRSEVLDCLHSAHQGVVGMKARARVSVYWPGMSKSITDRRLQCQTCNTIGPSQPAEPMVSSPPPQYPFEQVAADSSALWDNGTSCLLTSTLAGLASSAAALATPTACLSSASSASCSPYTASPENWPLTADNPSPLTTSRLSCPPGEFNIACHRLTTVRATAVLNLA